MSGTIYVVGNFKGGVGKTKTVTMLAYESARPLNERTLVIDMDPQGNATRVLAKTGNLVENYTNTRLTNRQREGFNQMYERLFDLTKNKLNNYVYSPVY